MAALLPLDPILSPTSFVLNILGLDLIFQLFFLPGTGLRFKSVALFLGHIRASCMSQAETVLL
jgi:hypothetical protein